MVGTLDRIPRLKHLSSRLHCPACSSTSAFACSPLAALQRTCEAMRGCTWFTVGKLATMTQVGRGATGKHRRQRGKGCERMREMDVACVTTSSLAKNDRWPSTVHFHHPLILKSVYSPSHKHSRPWVRGFECRFHDSTITPLGKQVRLPLLIYTLIYIPSTRSPFPILSILLHTFFNRASRKLTLPVPYSSILFPSWLNAKSSTSPLSLQSPSLMSPLACGILRLLRIMSHIHTRLRRSISLSRHPLARHPTSRLSKRSSTTMIMLRSSE